MKIRVRLDELLEGRSYYWLGKATGIPLGSLYRLKNNQAKGMTFEMIEKLCEALECVPGDLITLVEPVQPKKAKKSK